MGSFAVHREKISYFNNVLLFFYSFAFYIHKILLPIRFSARYPIELSQFAPSFYAALSIVIFAGVLSLRGKSYYEESLWLRPDPEVQRELTTLKGN
jgi:hypothetical protein